MASVFCVGHAVQDFVFHVDRLPDKAEKYRANAFETVGGGPAATAAVAIAKLGGTARLAARLGEDAAADLLLGELQSFGVETEWIRRFTGVGTSVSSVLVDARGERRIVNYLDAGLPEAGDWLPARLPPGTDAVLADARWPSGARHMLNLAHAAGVPGVLDGDLPLAGAEEWVAGASHAAFSEPGLRDFTGCAEPEAGLEAAAAKTGRWCCVTLGERGTLICADGRVDHVPGYEVDTVDSLGAGDVWHGAFALSLAEGRGEEAAVRRANAAAAVTVGRYGARKGAPTARELEEFVPAQPAARREENAT